MWRGNDIIICKKQVGIHLCCYFIVSEAEVSKWRHDFKQHLLLLWLVVGEAEKKKGDGQKSMGRRRRRRRNKRAEHLAGLTEVKWVGGWKIEQFCWEEMKDNWAVPSKSMQWIYLWTGWKDVREKWMEVSKHCAQRAKENKSSDQKNARLDSVVCSTGKPMRFIQYVWFY